MGSARAPGEPWLRGRKGFIPTYRKLGTFERVQGVKGGNPEWPGRKAVLDVSCGIGTQALALAEKGFKVTGSDLSGAEIERAKVEAVLRGLEIPFSVCDMRNAATHHPLPFDLVLSCDNSLPHLLSDADILTALRQMHACLKPGGGCLITVRDYDMEERGGGTSSTGMPSPVPCDRVITPSGRTSFWP